MAKDPKPGTGRPSGGASRGGSGAQRSGGRGRTRPPVNVVTPQRPWGLIAAAVAVAVFAAAILTYAVITVNRSNANRITSADQLEGLETAEYAGAEHVVTGVDYVETPPVGGPHDNEWADCSGTVYDVQIRPENAVHSLEHGSTWITYDPDLVSDDDVATLEELVDGRAGLMLSPWPGQGAPISLQSWNHQLTVDSATDERVEQYVDFFTLNAEFHPEPGASCDNPAFLSEPLVVGDESRYAGAGDQPLPGVPSDAPVSSAPAELTEETGTP